MRVRAFVLCCWRRYALLCDVVYVDYAVTRDMFGAVSLDVIMLALLRVVGCWCVALCDDSIRRVLCIIAVLCVVGS